MQCDLNSIYEWSVDNQMFFNDEIFVRLKYKHPKSNSADTHIYKCADGSDMIMVNSTKDLGLLMDSAADFSMQVNEICKNGQWTWVD